MYCIAENRLYVKANGEVPCWCGIGEQKILHKADENTDFIKSVLFGDQYVHMRDSLRNGILPWPDICSKCFFLKRDDPFVERPVTGRKLNAVQFEPSFLCNLDCLACFPEKKGRKKEKSPPYNMPFELFEKVVDDICRAGLSVHHFDFQGRGEPLLNSNVWKMVSYIRKRFPDGFITLTTNANFEYDTEATNSGLSRLIVSVDGCFEDSYREYRKGGSLGKAFEFIKRSVEEKRKHKSKTEVFWKYILFGHNDSDKELIATQKKAAELGVDILLFDLTTWLHKCRPSRFYGKEDILNFPVLYTKKPPFELVLPKRDEISNILNIGKRANFDDIREANNKKLVVFGAADERTVNMCMKNLSELLPGFNIDFIGYHEPNVNGTNGITINSRLFGKDTPLSEVLIGHDGFGSDCVAGIICSSDYPLFPNKLDFFYMARKLNCQRIMSYTVEKSFESIFFG